MSSDFLYKVVLISIKLWKMITWLVIPTLSGTIKLKFVKACKKMGVTVNGPAVHDIQVKDERLYNRVAQDGTLGLGEGYMEGWWDCQRLDKLFHKFALGNALERVMRPWDYLIYYLQYHLFNLQTTPKCLQVVNTHYDIGNKFFESFLDPSMNYSCGYWKEAGDLNEAQQNKMDLIARKLKLKENMRVLDIGCGWGGLCQFLAVNYKVQVVGINISTEGVKAAKERCKGLPVDIRLQDYRTMDEKFDRIVSVGMFEHVGIQNYAEFFQVAHRCLEDGGIFLLHTIGVGSDKMIRIEPWIDSYIFPNGNLPRLSDITKHSDQIFTLEDLHNFGNDYNKTLLAWHANFVKNWPTVEHLFPGKERKMFRMWEIFFMCCAGGFSARKVALWQIIFTKNGLQGGYDSVR